MKTICATLESGQVEHHGAGEAGETAACRYNMTEDAELLPLVREITDGRPSYGYRRDQALLNHRLVAEGRPRVNH